MDMNNTNHLSVNTQLSNRYVVGRAMGSNKLGITYLGYDNTANKKVAIKEYYPESMASRNDNMVSGTDTFALGLQQFVKDGNILKEKKGLPSIVEVFDVIEENGTAYIIMEYIEGTSLEEIVKGNRLFPIARMQSLLEPVLKSLYVLHEAGLIHQNISPDNLIFTNEGILKLIGFGCLEGNISDKSRGYAPIEQYSKQEEKKPSIDIYAICATIYCCITGKTPVDATQRAEQLELQTPSSMGIEVSEVQEAVIMMGLSVEAEKRLQGIQALYRALYGTALNTVAQAEVKAEPTTKPVEPVVKSELVAKPVEPEVKPEAVAKPEQKAVVPPVQQQPQPTPVQPAAPVQSQPTPVQQPVQTNVQNPVNKEKKKGSNKGLVIGICVALVLFLIVGVGGVLIATRLFTSNISTKTTVTEVAESGESMATDETQAVGATVAGTDKVQEIKDTLAAQDYEAAIDMLLALSDEEKAAFGETEFIAILQEAVDGKKNAILTEVDGYVNSASYDEAFVAISDGIVYFTSISTNEAVADLADIQFLDDKAEEIKQKHKDYLSRAAESCANQADEAGMEDALTGLESYLSAEEIEEKRIKCNGKLVVAMMTQMRNNGAATEEILMYIDENLAKTDNNCWVLEFWDYYHTVYMMESGQGISTDTTIRNVSDSGYLLDHSNTMNLTTDDISHLSQYELYLALYEIYARHGRGFNDASVTSYFSQYSWYQETTRPEVFDESILNEYEKYNRDLIIEYQYAMGYR